MNNWALGLYMQICFGKKIKINDQLYSYEDIKNGETVSYSDFIKFLRKKRDEESQFNLFNYQENDAN